MAFDVIENVAKQAAPTVPLDGVRVSGRAMGRSKAAGGGLSRFIKLELGGHLARALALHGDSSKVKLQFGNGPDAGKIRLSVDVSGGSFPVKKGKKDVWSLTINEATAEGLFALNFPPHIVEKVNVVPRACGMPPFAVFVASEAMLAVDD